MKTNRTPFHVRHPRSTVLAAWLAVIIGTALIWFAIVVAGIELVNTIVRLLAG